MGRPDFYTSYAGIIRIRFKGPETAFLSLHLSREGSQRPCVRLSCGWPYFSMLFQIVKPKHEFNFACGIAVFGAEGKKTAIHRPEEPYEGLPP